MLWFLKRTTVIGRSGSQASLLTSLLSFFLPGLLRLHCMTFSPAPLKPWVSGEPIWPEVSLSKASRHSTHLFLFVVVVSSFFLSLHTPPDLSGLIPPLQRRHDFHCNDFTCKTQLLLPLLLEFRGLPLWQSRPKSAPFCSNCPSLMAFYYSNQHCHLEIKQRTALWGKTWEFKHIWWADKILLFIKGSATLEKLKTSVVYMRFQVLHRCCFIHDKFSSFNNLDLIADKPLRWRFIGPCKLFEGLPGEGSLSCVSSFFFPHVKEKNEMICLNHPFFFWNTVYLSRFWLMKGGDQTF